MAYPQDYTRLFDFEAYQNGNPTRPLPGVRVNLDLNDIARAVSETNAFLRGVTRSDGALANNSVGLDQLDASVAIGLTAPEQWAPDTDYTLTSAVFHEDVLYKAAVAHTSGATFDEDLWTVLADFAPSSAAGEAVTPEQYGADGTAAGDTAGIQAAIDSGAKEIEFAGRVYLLERPGLVGASNQRWRGVEGSTILRATEEMGIDANSDMIYFTAKTNVVFDGITFDGNNFLLGVGHFPGLLPCIHFTGGSKLRVRNCRFIGWSTVGLLVNVTNNIIIQNNTFERDATSNGPTSSGNAGLSVTGTGTVDASNAYDFVIDNNLVINTSIGVSGRDGTISNNIVRGHGFGAGIHSQSLASNFNLRIVGNTCFASGTAQDLAGAYPGGIENWAHSSVVANNVCYENAACGINAGGKNSVYSNNVCYNNGQAGVAGSAGIGAFAQDATFHCGGSIFVGNKCYDDQGTPTQEYGYLEHPNLTTYSVTGVTLGVNEFTGNELGDVLLENITRGGHMIGSFEVTGGFTGGFHNGLTNLSLANSGFNHFLATGGTLTGNRTLTFNINDGDRTINIANNVTLAGAFSTSGGHALTFTTTNATNVTLPTTGTLATLAGAEAFTNKTLTSPTITGGTANALTALSVANGGFQQAFAVTGALTANRAFTVNLNDAARTLSLSGDLTVAGATTISSFGASLVDDADASAARTTLGLGTAAVKNTGTSGDAVPLLNGAAATWTNSATWGPGTGAINNVINGGNSGAGAGAVLSLQNAGATVCAIGNADVILGGAYTTDVIVFTGAEAIRFVGGAVHFTSISTTASAANAFLDSGATNNLLRSTSSGRYKADVVGISDDEATALVEGLRPIKYRSKAEADDPDRQHIGLIAEEVAEVDPRFVHFDGEGRPDGVQYDRIGVALLSVVKGLKDRMDRMEGYA